MRLLTGQLAPSSWDLSRTSEHWGALQISSSSFGCGQSTLQGGEELQAEEDGSPRPLFTARSGSPSNWKVKSETSGPKAPQSNRRCSAISSCSPDTSCMYVQLQIFPSSCMRLSQRWLLIIFIFTTCFRFHFPLGDPERVSKRDLVEPSYSSCDQQPLSTLQCILPSSNIIWTDWKFYRTPAHEEHSRLASPSAALFAALIDHIWLTYLSQN